MIELSDKEIRECAKGNERCSIEGRGRISYVCDDGYDGRYCICDEYIELIHVKGQCTALDGRETYHKVFEGLFGLQFYATEARILPKDDFAMQIRQEMQTTNDPPRGMYFSLGSEACRGNARNYQPLYCLRHRRSTWPLAIA